MLAAVLLVGLSLAGGEPAAAQVPALAFYRYEAERPLAPERALVEETDAYSRYHLRYQSVSGQTVTAILQVPKGDGPFPAVMVQHGWGASKTVDYVDMPARLLAGQGYVTLAIDAANHGERAGEGLPNDLFNLASVESRRAFVQTVIDLRRGVDYLQSLPEVAGDRIGYLGFSMGAIIGAVFCGVEERVRCSTLVVGGGNLRARFNEGDPEVIAENEAIVEPCRYVGMIAPRPVLFINGKRDDVIGRESAEALQNAAREPKRIVWYDSGHYDLPIAETLQELGAFFAANLNSP